MPTTTTATATAPARLDLYGPIHKGLRAFLASTLLDVGALDSGDDFEVKQVLDQLDELLACIASHLGKEDRYVHPALCARRPGSTQAIDAEHADHRALLQRLRDAAHALACAEPETREAAASRLYRDLARFVAADFDHMAREESDYNALLWATHDDDELAELHAAMVAATPPAEMALWARWMVPHLSAAERAALLAGMRASLPADVFDALLALVRPHLDERRRRSGEALGLAPTIDGAEQVVRDFVDAMCVRFDAAGAKALVTPDCVAHPWLAAGVPPGPAGNEVVASLFGRAFAEVTCTIEDAIAARDRVVLRYVYEGRHVGDLFGLPATSRRFRLTGVFVARVEGGRIAEYWREEDQLGMLRQLGVSSW